MGSLFLIAAFVALEPPVSSVEELPRLLGEEYDLLRALDQLDEDARQQEEALAENQQQRDEITQRRDRAATRHENAMHTLEEERARIRRRIRVYIELRRTQDWQLALSTGDYAAFLRTRRLLRQLVQDDEQRIRDYHGIVDQYEEARAAYDHELAALEGVNERIATARAQLERDRAIKSALLESIRSEREFFIKAHQNLDAASEALVERIQNFDEWRGKRLWFRDLKGQYQHPLAGGRISKSFGNHTHPRFGTVTMHRGITMVPGRTGNRKVRVLYWGRVVYADWLRGYGKTIIVDHTKGDYTVYAHLSEMQVGVGDVLRSRQPIGVIGRTGSLEEESLYFELRLDGRPVNPYRWFR